MFPIILGAVDTYKAFLASILSLSPQYNELATSVPATDRIFKTTTLTVLVFLSLTKLESNAFDVLSKKSVYIKEIENAKVEFRN